MLLLCLVEDLQRLFVQIIVVLLVELVVLVCHRGADSVSVSAIACRIGDVVLLLSELQRRYALMDVFSVYRMVIEKVKLRDKVRVSRPSI